MLKFREMPIKRQYFTLILDHPCLNMNKVFLTGVPYLIGGILHEITARIYNRQTFNLKLFPGVLINLIKIIGFSFLSKKKNGSVIKEILCLVTLNESTAFIDAFFAIKVSGIFCGIAASSKFLFIASLSYFMLKRRFTYIQLSGLTIILLVVSLSAYDTRNQKNDEEFKSAYHNFIVVIFSSFLSSLAEVYFDKYIKRSIVDPYTYMLDYSIVYIFVSLATASIETVLIKDVDRVLNTIGTFKFNLYVFLCIVQSYFGFSIAIKLEPIGRSFLNLLLGNITSIIIEYIESKIISLKSFLLLMIINLGIFTYEFERVKKYYRMLMVGDRNDENLSGSPAIN